MVVGGGGRGGQPCGGGVGGRGEGASPVMGKGADCLTNILQGKN